MEHLTLGFPAKIISDQGDSIQSQLTANLCQPAGCHPQPNGECEHFNSTLLKMFGTFSSEKKKDWKAYVPALVHAYNCTKNAATGYSPYYIIYWR